MILLLLITLFSNYDLFYCNRKGQPTFKKPPLTALIHKSIRDIDKLLQNFQKEIRNEKTMLRSVDFEEGFKEDVGLFDYNVTPLWWKNKTSGNVTVEDNTTHSTFLMLEGITDGLWASPLPEITKSPTVTTSSPLYDSDEIFYRDQTSINPFPSISFWPEAVRSIPGYTPLLPSFSPGGSRSTTLNPMTTINLDYLPSWTTTEVYPALRSSSAKVGSSEATLSIPALRGISSAKFTSSSKMSTTLRPQNKLKRNLTVSPTELRVKLKQTTPKLRRPPTTLSKAQAWVRNRQWTTSTRSHTSPSNSTRLLRDLAQRQGDTMSTQTAYTEELLQTNKDGFLHVSMPDVVETTPYIEPTVAGDVLYSADAFTAMTEGEADQQAPNKEYHEMMNKTDEGYIMVFLMEFCRIVAEKDEKLVMEVLQHSEVIINDYVSENKLVFAGSRITQVFIYFGKLMTESVFNEGFIHNYALMMHMMLTERFTSLSAEINALIDYTDMLYDDVSGEALLEVLGQFEDYTNHNSSKTPQELCLDLLEHVVEPFRAIADTERGQRLIDSIHQALTDRWDSIDGGYRKWRGHLMKMSEKAIPKANLLSAFYRSTTTLSLKRKISMKRRQLNLTQQVTNNNRRQYYQTPWYPMIRSMLPITRRQTRFKVITPRSSRNNLYTNIERPTQRNYRRRRGRPSYPTNGMLEFFPQVPVEMEKAEKFKAVSSRRNRKIKKKKKTTPKVDVQ